MLRQGVAALTAAAALPLGAGALLLRPRLWNGLGERLGVWPRLATGGVWVHASAVGEIRAASRMVDLLRASGRPVATSTWTLPGRVAARRFQPEVPCHLAPIDHPWCVAAALARVAPAVLVLVETELWPSWIAAAERRGVPVVLVSGRVSDRSFPRYRRLGAVLGPTLRRLHAIGARSETDAERFRALGADPAQVAVTGDLKLDFELSPPPLPGELERLLGDAPLLVAGSTHPGEEVAVLDAMDALEARGAQAALLLAPRHPPRAGEVERLVRRRGRKVWRRSQPAAQPLTSGEVLVLDTVGELAALYPRAAVAFVGGTFSDVGGHNVLEPAVAGRPVLFGPHIANVRHAAEILLASGGARQVLDAAGLAAAAAELLLDPALADARGLQGRRALDEHRGSAERSLALVEAALAARADA